MLAWIFESEEYTQLYHEYFSRFISQYFDSGYFEQMFDSVVELISPYVEKDPTAFCTYEEFRTGCFRSEGILSAAGGECQRSAECDDSI